MFVSELRDILKNFDGDRLVLISSDEEGNSFRALERNHINTGACTNDAEFEIEVGLEHLTEALEGMGYSDEDVIVNGIPALVLG